MGMDKGCIIISEKGGDKEQSSKKGKGKNKRRCYSCNVRLSMIEFKCKCGHIFCQKHLNAHSHNCTFDYSSERKDKIEKDNPKISQKFEKIN
ncbi:MAG: hypothetical protein CL470_09085 [Acidimicrobiaceae bacterium]|nr:hypothetical protein [Acidimicrobiaceae bacterium]|tara:strand:- start:159 stop:434 length:276 start_codon:yes stop_codon:yes gene_type:complete